MAGRLHTHTQGLNPHQAELIKQTSITPEQIFENMDALNEEIQETYESKLPETNTQPKVPKPSGQLTVKKVHEPVPPQKEETPMTNPEELEQSLEAELAAIEAKAAEQRAKQEEQATETESSREEELSPAEQQRQRILELLASTPGAPTEAQINALKAKYDNSVHLLALGEGDVYIFTHLRRGQWQKIRKLVTAGQDGNVGVDPNEMLKEKVIQYTVLWPKVGSPEFLYNSRAGVVDTLYETVLLHSYFLTPQQAMMLTTQL